MFKVLHDRYVSRIEIHCQRIHLPGATIIIHQPCLWGEKIIKMHIALEFKECRKSLQTLSSGGFGGFWSRISLLGTILLRLTFNYLPLSKCSSPCPPNANQGYNSLAWIYQFLSFSAWALFPLQTYSSTEEKKIFLTLQISWHCNNSKFSVISFFSKN